MENKLSKLDYMKREVKGLLNGSCCGIYCDLTDKNKELLELQGYKQWGTMGEGNNIYAIDKLDSDEYKEYIPLPNDGDYIKFYFGDDGEPYFNDARYKMENNKNNTINLDKMKQENVVVHCDTEDKARKLLTVLKEDGYVWSGLNKDLLRDIEYKKHHTNTCYRIPYLDEKEISFSGYDFYDKNNYKIISFDDLLEAPEYLTAEQVEQEETITQQSTKKYVVSVVGGKAPKHIHNSLKSAEAEAKRLAGKEIGKEVMVLEYIKSYQAKVIVEEI